MALTQKEKNDKRVNGLDALATEFVGFPITWEQFSTRAKREISLRHYKSAGMLHISLPLSAFRDLELKRITSPAPLAPDAGGQVSRSVARRVAAQKGEPVPEFEGDVITAPAPQDVVE